MAKLKFNRAVLVYQAGIANVFTVESFNLCDFGRGAKRLLQGTFGQCEMFARGLGAAGVMVISMHCNEAGDIKERKWSDNLDEAPFNASMHPVRLNTTGIGGDDE